MRDGGVSVQAQSGNSATTDQSWAVRSFIWSEEGNAWARTNCTMTIGGFGSSVLGESAQSLCSNRGRAPLSFVHYYHDTDPDDRTPADSTDAVFGKLKGRAWSPLYGVIYFDPSDFPASTSCYGLTGANRQARIRRSGGEVQLVGCAYVPLFQDYILFNRSGAAHSNLPSSGWSGVRVTTVEDVASAYLALHGCAWSSKNGFWSFGPNKASAASKENCLPSTHDTALKKVLPESRIGSPGGVVTVINPTRTSAKIGQEVGYQYACPDGYATPSLRIGSRIVSAILALFRGSYREIFTDPVSNLLLTCTDRSGVFTTVRNSSGSFAPSVKESFFVSSFTAMPSVLTAGGFVSFGGQVSNQGGFSDRSFADSSVGHCDNTAQNKCVYGTPNDAAVPDDATYYKWRCDGVSGVHSATCQLVKAQSARSTQGQCDNAVRNTCTVGTANDIILPDTATHYRWQCGGAQGGGVSGACQIPKAAIPGNQGYCVIIDKVTGRVVRRFDVEGINVPISGSDLTVRDAVYTLQCQYKKFTADGSFDTWQPVPVSSVAVKVLPQGISEQNTSVSIGSPVFSELSNTVSVTIPSGAAMVHVYRLDSVSATRVGADSLYKVFVDRGAVALSEGETLSEIKARLFAPTVRSKVLFVSSGSGGITKSAVIDKSLVAVARTAGGVWSQRVTHTLSVDGFCDISLSVRNRCITGTVDDAGVADSATHYRWRCVGAGNGQSSSVCETYKPVDGGWSDWAPPSTDAACGGTLAQTRSCTNPTPAHGGAACSGSSSRQGPGTGCPRRDEVCRDGSCDAVLPLCEGDPPPPIFANWVGSANGRSVQCLWKAKSSQHTFPVGRRGDRHSVHANSFGGVYRGFGSLVFACGDSGWEEVESESTCALVSTPTCDETVRNGCVYGTAQDEVVEDTPTHYRWLCLGESERVGDYAECERHKPIDGDWGDWGPLPDVAVCGSAFTQTRTCTNPAPSYDGAACSGTSSRQSVGTKCPSGQGCKDNVCKEIVRCAAVSTPQVWQLRDVLCLATASDGGFVLPAGEEGDRYTLQANSPSFGTGYAVFECSQSSRWVRTAEESICSE